MGWPCPRWDASVCVCVCACLLCTQVVQLAFAGACPANCDLSSLTLGQVVTQLIEQKSQGLYYMYCWLYRCVDAHTCTGTRIHTMQTRVCVHAERRTMQHVRELGMVLDFVCVCVCACSLPSIKPTDAMETIFAVKTDPDSIRTVRAVLAAMTVRVQTRHVTSYTRAACMHYMHS